MKKSLIILAAAAVFLSGIVVTGCAVASAAKDALEDSYKTWYKYKKDVEIPLGATDNSDKDVEEHKLQNGEVYVYFDPDVGLKVAIQSRSQQDIDMLKGLLSTTVEVVSGGTKDYPKESFGKAKWSGFMASGKFEKSEAPKIVTNPKECIKLFGDDANDCKIQWKKVFANILLDKLLKD